MMRPTAVLCLVNLGGSDVSELCAVVTDLLCSVHSCYRVDAREE